MAGKKTDLEALLGLAEECERKYDWRKAAEDYQSILESMPDHEAERIGAVLERKAFALYKAALQAEDVESFAEAATRAMKAYEDARSSLMKLDSPLGQARARRCDGMLAYIRFLRAADAEEKGRAVSESWEHAREALNGFMAAGDMTELCKTFYDLCHAAVYRVHMTPDFETRKRIWIELLAFGEAAAGFARDLEDDDDSIRILVLVSTLLNRAGYAGLCEEDPLRLCTESRELMALAKSRSEKKMLFHLHVTYPAGEVLLGTEWDARIALQAGKKSLELVRNTNDRHVIGHAYAGVAYYAFFAGFGLADIEEGDAFLAEALEAAHNAGNEFRKTGFMGVEDPNIWVMCPDVDFATERCARENDLDRKREFAQSVLDGLPERERLSRLAGYQLHILTCSLNAGIAYRELAKTEHDPDKKESLLKKAVEKIKEGVAGYELMDSGLVYNLGVYHNQLAHTQCDLAEATRDARSSENILREAIELAKGAIRELEEAGEWMRLTSDRTYQIQRGQWYYDLGRRHLRLYEMNHDRNALNEALQCCKRSREVSDVTEEPSRVAESLWMAAKVYEALGDPLKASEHFHSASIEFKRAAEEIPRLRSLFLEQSTYMEAWEEFEKAKHYHLRQEYHQAHTHFDKAADIQEALEKWRYLAPSCRACSFTDKAEALSREDRRDDATAAFEEAASLFEKSTASLKNAGKSVDNADEARIIARLTVASGHRRRYCLARAMIERARQMDVEGQSSSSSDMYKSAADELDQLASEAESTENQRDIKLLAILARAWQKMNQAETDLSSEPYAAASALFEQAKELSGNDRAKALVLGHSRFCRALEVGMKFTDTLEANLHTAAVKNLESASSYYLKAGADSYSEYARASKLLFDSYACLVDAGQEKEQEKAARIYTKAEKVLMECSESYMSAGQPGKRDQVLKLLERVKRERAFAVSLTGILEAPSDASPANSFNAPLPPMEDAVGLDRFVHADVQAALIVPRTNLRVGDEMAFDIELVNAGRATALLTKVENVVPEGFEVRSKPASFRVEEDHLVMKGKRLEPLKTEEISITLEPRVQGKFLLRPRILYIDDTGSYKVRETEACEVTVKELGVTGWLKGPA